MADTRLKDRNWVVADHDGKAKSIEHVQTALLMDIRDELQTLNRLLGCPNVQRAAFAAIDTAKAVKRIDKRLATKVKL